MRFEAALEQALARAKSEPAEGLLAIAGEVDLDPEDWLGTPGPLFYWDTRRADADAGEISVALGEARVLEAEGRDRFAPIQRRATALMLGIERFGPASPRCFGGFAFEPGRLGVFSRFADARFVLPRWRATRNRAGTGVELVVCRRELRWPHALFAELSERLAASRPRADQARAGLVTTSDGAAAFLSATTRAIADVGRGELQKVVVARKTRVAGGLSLARVLDRLSLEPETVSFALSVGPSAFVGATPELLVATDGRLAASEAVAGTMARRGDDEREIHELSSSDKELREHAHVARAIRGAFTRVGAELERAAPQRARSLHHVHHLVTPIRARAEGIHVLELVSALHPTPAVCGVPRERAAEWLVENEAIERGWFAAPLGWFDDRGRGVFVVALRSALLEADAAHLFAGAGIVAGSSAARELFETEAKLSSMRAALGVDGSARARTGFHELGGAP